jgi:hypothetical protein
MIQYIHKQILSADILQLFSTPIEILPAPGADICICPMRWVYQMSNVSTPYDTNKYLYMYIDTATDSFCVRSSDAMGPLVSTIDRILWGYPEFSGAAGVSVFIPGKSLKIKVLNGNPLNGDGDLDIYLWYEERELT